MGRSNSNMGKSNWEVIVKLPVMTGGGLGN